MVRLLIALNFFAYTPPTLFPSAFLVFFLPATLSCTSQSSLITSPPPKGSHFLIARPSCSSIPQINSPPLCYSYYLGVLELAWPSKQTLYCVFFFSHTPSQPYQWSYITAEHGMCPWASEVTNGQRYRALIFDIKVSEG